MASELINPLTNKKDIPDIRPGDTVKVYQKINEGKKEKNQIFTGRVISIKHGQEAGGTITVRRESKGAGADVAVEKIFPIYSPIVSKIEITERKKVRRAKLYYLRKIKKRIHLKKGKEINKKNLGKEKEEKGEGDNKKEEKIDKGE